MEADILTGCIGGGVRGFHRHSDGIGDSDRGEDNDGRVIGGSSCDRVGREDTPAVFTVLRLHR